MSNNNSTAALLRRIDLLCGYLYQNVMTKFYNNLYSNLTITNMIGGVDVLQKPVVVRNIWATLIFGSTESYCFCSKLSVSQKQIVEWFYDSAGYLTDVLLALSDLIVSAHDKVTALNLIKGASKHASDFAGRIGDSPHNLFALFDSLHEFVDMHWENFVSL